MFYVTILTPFSMTIYLRFMSILSNWEWNKEIIKEDTGEGEKGQQLPKKELKNYEGGVGSGREI